LEAIKASFNPWLFYYLAKFNEGEPFEIAQVIFQREGIIFDKKAGVVSWADLGTKAYHGYYALYSQQDPNTYKAFEYLHDWNTVILYSVSRQILKDKKLWSE